MPWWGWLIAGVVGAVLLTWLAVNVFIVRTMRGVIREDVDTTMGRRWANRPDGWRR